MANKKLLIGLGTLASVVVLGGSLTYVYLSSQNESTQPTTQLTYSKSSTSASSADSTTESVVSETTETTQAESTRILDHLNEIQDVVKQLNDFTNGTSKYYNQVVEKFAKYGITVDESTVKGGFGVYDDVETLGTTESGGAVLAGIVQSISYTQDSDNQVTFNVVARTGHGAKNGTATQTGKYIRNYIKENGTDVSVTYVLTINEDGTTGTLTRTDGQWW